MASEGSSSSVSPDQSVLSVSSILRSFSERSEADKPFVPFVGGPRMFILLLYASVILVASIEFFASQDIWYGSWEIYNTYVFAVTGVFVFLGMLMLLTSSHDDASEYRLPIPRIWLGTMGFAMLAVSGAILAIGGKDLGGWAIPLSVALLYGFLMMLLGGRAFGPSESYKLIMYGTGLVAMVLVPVHEAFGFAHSGPDENMLTLTNLVLLISGMCLALVSVQSIQTRDGFVGAWLMGAMAIFLIAFHEQLGIMESGTYSPYDRTLALMGITFSFLPLVMYVWRERVYFFLWNKLKNANTLIEKGDYASALKLSEDAIRQCARVGIDDRFALPWSLKADALYRMKDYQKAMVAYDSALKIDPTDSVSWCHLGNMHAFEGKQEAALKAFDRAIGADPKNGFAWNNKGAIYQKLNMVEDALICFDKAARLMPDPFDAHINAAQLFSKLRNSQDALRHYQAALTLRPGSLVAKEGVEREHFRGMCMDQISGWEQLGLDTSYLKHLLDSDSRNFVKKSREFLASIVDQQTQLRVVPGKEHIDVNAAIKKILGITEGAGASLEKIKEETNLSDRDLILPLALLMETEHVHFKMVGGRQVYVSKGKAPEKPVLPPEPPPAAVSKPPEQPRVVQKLPMPPPLLPPARLFARRVDKPKPVPKPVERPAKPEAELPVFTPRSTGEEPVPEPPKQKPEARPAVVPEQVPEEDEEPAEKPPEKHREEKKPQKKPRKVKELKKREVVKAETTASILVFRRKK